MPLLDFLRLGSAERETLAPVAERAKTLGEFFEAIGEKLEDFDLPDAVAGLLPWASDALGLVGKAAAEATPPVNSSRRF
jgi:hypothetical protein